MSLYLSAATIRDAVGRLASSGARSRLTDYLVFRRALVLGAASTVTLSEKKDEVFQQALEEITATAAPGEADENPAKRRYFSPFGAARDKRKLGFKESRYPSHGPSNTIMDWNGKANAPIQLVPDTKPIQITPIPDLDAHDLAVFFMVRNPLLPNLLDAAIWLYRFVDLQERFGASPTAHDLTGGFVEDLDLNQAETDALFTPAPPEDSALLEFTGFPASPGDYLPTAADVAPSHLVADDLGGQVGKVVDYVAGRGFVFQDWQVAAYITAVRTKPFVILAGISGTGKTKLPKLVAEATGAYAEVIPVRPDWTDSSDVIGYQRLTEEFVPGGLLRVAKRALDNPTQQHFVILDEMNIARVEYYFAEVLSRIEDRERDINGRIVSPPLLPEGSESYAGELASVYIPDNLCIVGSVNMDETTHGFSRKVLDRSFVIEFSDINLIKIEEAQPVEATPWPVAEWRQKYLGLAEFPNRYDAVVIGAIGVLNALNEFLIPAQLQVGYRVRDEVALFCANALSCEDYFTESGETSVDPLDLAICMKVLPRIQGGGTRIRSSLEEMLKWAKGASESDADEAPPEQATAHSFPKCIERLEIMLQGLEDSGFASYWL